MNTADEQADEATSSMSITQLPEVVLVAVMKYLTLKERYYLSQTCHLFHKFFSHPSLWQVAHINLISHFGSSGSDKTKYSTWNVIPVNDETLKNLVHRFKFVLRQLHLEMSGVYRPLKDVCYSVLLALNKAHQLEKLTLQIGTFTIEPYVTHSSSLKDLYLINGLIRNAVSLRHISIESWPFELEAGDEDSIILSLLNNSNIIHLRTLQLFYMDGRDETWAKKISPLPSTEVTLRIVSHFKHLECLSLRSPMLSNALFKELADSSRNMLSVLKVLIVYSNDLHNPKTPKISPSAWSSLKQASPHCKIEYVLTSRTPLDQLQHLFHPSTTLTSLTILKFGRCDASLIELVRNLFSASLESFVCYCDSQNCDEALKLLLDSCSNLKHLVYCGSIASKTVVEMAEMIHLQKRIFATFKFSGKNIKTDDFIEDDTVISKTCNNELYLVSFEQWHRSTKDHLSKLDVLSQTVFYLIGCHCLLE